MAKFHSLIVTDVENTIRDAIVVSLRPKRGQRRLSSPKASI